MEYYSVMNSHCIDRYNKPECIATACSIEASYNKVPTSDTTHVTILIYLCDILEEVDLFDDRYSSSCVISRWGMVSLKSEVYCIEIIS